MSENIDFSTDIKADFCLRVQDDSMVGARIHDGDLVFVRKQEMVDNGEIAVVAIEDKIMLSQVYYYPERQQMILQPTNSNYEPLVFVDNEINQIRILGKAVACLSEMRAVS